MAQLIKTDLLQVFDDNDFEIDDTTIKSNEFTGPDGKKQVYFTASWKYKGQEPCFIEKGSSYGIQKGDDKPEGEGGATPAAPPGMVQLPSAPKNGDKKKEKWQVAVIMTKKPAPKDWTLDEAKKIDFLENGLRRILARVLTRRMEIVQKTCPNIIVEAQKKFLKDIQENPQSYIAATETDVNILKAQKFQAILCEAIYDKITKKVYRKKKEQKEGAPINFMDPNAIYDDTKYPTLYSTIQSFISKKTKEEVFVTQYYKGDEKLPETEWKTLSHAEAAALGSHVIEAAVKYGDIFFGGNGTISIQLKAAEVVFFEAIQLGNIGHKGRLITNTNPDVKRDTRLVTRTPIMPVGNNNNIPNNQAVDQLQQQQLLQQQLLQQQQLQQQQQMQQQYVAQDQTQASNVFNPATLAGLQGMQIPQVVTNHTQNYTSQ